jgi:hypothetical protein
MSPLTHGTWLSGRHPGREQNAPREPSRPPPDTALVAPFRASGQRGQRNLGSAVPAVMLNTSLPAQLVGAYI